MAPRGAKYRGVRQTCPSLPLGCKIAKRPAQCLTWLRRRMFEISTIADDYVVKGLHIRLREIELAVHPDHSGAIVFRRVFASTPEADVDAAIREANEVLRKEPQAKQQLFDTAFRAREFLQGYTGALADLANGRAAEITFIMHALKKLGGVD